MSQEYVDLLLSEIHQLRKRMDERFDDVYKSLADRGEEIAAVSTQMKSLIGSGEPGRIQIIETSCVNCRKGFDERLTDLEHTHERWLGKESVVSCIVAGIISLAVAAHTHLMEWLTSLFR